jgi:hypothetical protein
MKEYTYVGNEASLQNIYRMQTAMLPDGIFSNQKSQFGKILKGLAMEDVGILMAFLSILRPNGIFYSHLVHFVVNW